MARGDAEFVEFVHGSSARLLHAAYLLTGDRQGAEDATQTALTRTYASWSRVHKQDAYAYARKVLVNHLADRWRRPVREYAAEEMPEPPPPQRELADEVALRRWVVEALGLLTSRERAVVVLRHFFDLSEAEVARELNVSLGTVKSTASRALSKLRVSTDPRADEPGGADHAGAVDAGGAERSLDQSPFKGAWR